MDILSLVILALLIALTAFFVATEFAIVKVRSTRIDQLAEEGKAGAIAAKKVITHLDEYLSACQLGITVTSLGMGWIGEPAVASVLEPLLIKMSVPESATHVISFIVAFSLVTYLHVVIGELAPKTFAIHKACCPPDYPILQGYVPIHLGIKWISATCDKNVRPETSFRRRTGSY